MSLTSRMVHGLMRLVGARRFIERSFANPPRTGGVVVADRFSGDLSARDWRVAGCNLVTVSLPDKVEDALTHVYFLHGGAYVLEGTPLHRRLLETLARRFGLRVTYIEYPLGPEQDVNVCHAAVREAYQELHSAYPSDRICLLGDSAGGGLALALLHHLRDSASVLPSRTVLVSPWVDASMSHPEAPAFQSRDLMLTIGGLVRAAEDFAHGEPLRGALLAPSFQDQSHLGNVLLLVSTHELFFPDCRDLNERMQAAEGTDVEFVVGEGLTHDWVILPTPEGRASVCRIGEYLQVH